jgi:O-methyltransferase involved in polyketide biosynthesis
MYDYWLGGKDNFACDRAAAEKMEKIFPWIGLLAQENRKFLDRAVTYVARQGIKQFLDVGAGLPTAVNTHEIAQSVTPDARVAYVDNDPVVVNHAVALLAKTHGVAAFPGDARDPKTILSDPRLASVISLSEPVCVILAALLHFIDPVSAREMLATLIDAMPAGSYLIISVPTGHGDGAFAREYPAADLYVHSYEQIVGFFDGVDLIPPGVADARFWSPGVSAPEPFGRRWQGTFLAGVGYKPARSAG